MLGGGAVAGSDPVVTSDGAASTSHLGGAGGGGSAATDVATIPDPTTHHHPTSTGLFGEDDEYYSSGGAADEIATGEPKSTTHHHRAGTRGVTVDGEDDEEALALPLQEDTPGGTRGLFGEEDDEGLALPLQKDTARPLSDFSETPDRDRSRALPNGQDAAAGTRRAHDVMMVSDTSFRYYGAVGGGGDGGAGGSGGSEEEEKEEGGAAKSLPKRPSLILDETTLSSSTSSAGRFAEIGMGLQHLTATGPSLSHSTQSLGFQHVNGALHSSHGHYQQPPESRANTYTPLLPQNVVGHSGSGGRRYGSIQGGGGNGDGGESRIEDPLTVSEVAMVKKDKWKIMLCYFLYEMNTIFGYQTLLLCYLYLAKQCERKSGNVEDYNFVANNLMAYNTLALVGMHFLSMVFDLYNVVRKPYNVMRFCAVGLLAVFVVIALYKDVVGVLVVWYSHKNLKCYCVELIIFISFRPPYNNISLDYFLPVPSSQECSPP